MPLVCSCPAVMFRGASRRFLGPSVGCLLVVHSGLPGCLILPLLAASCSAVFLLCAVCRTGVVFLLPPQVDARHSVLVFVWL